MAVRIDTYFKYFLHQWLNHPDLQGDNKGFRMVSVEEALGDFRSGIKEKGFAMRLIEYSYTPTTAGGDEGRKILQGGFILVKYHSKRSSGEAGYIQARAACEKVVDEIIEKMVADSRAGHELFYYGLDAVDGVNVQPEIAAGDGFYSGCLVTFTLAPFFRQCPAETAWGDGGLTPELTDEEAIAWAISTGGNWLIA